MTLKIVKPFKYIKTFSLQFTVDTDMMQVNGLKFSTKFNDEIVDLARCDLIQDIIYLLEKDKGRSFKSYYESIKPEGK